MIAQEDDPELLEWLALASEQGGTFLKSVANAGLMADWENYPHMRDLLVWLRAKYPQYEPSPAVKREISERKTAWPAMK